MKKSLILGMSLCLLLSGCSPAMGDGEGDTTAPITQNKPTLGDLSTDVAEQKAAYYQQLASDLEAELLSLKTQLYTERAQFEAKIETLEQALKPTVGNVATDFRYTVTDGKITLESYIGTGTSVTIPTEIDGCPVVAIGDRAFENNLKLTEILIPEGVQSIGWFAFSGCIALKTVTLPKSLSVVQYGAFQNCPTAMTVTCPEGSYARAYAESYGMAVR